FELFIEMTNMVSRKYKPVLTIINIFLKSDNLTKIKHLYLYRAKRNESNKIFNRFMVIICLGAVIFTVSTYFYLNTTIENPVQYVATPYSQSDSNEILSDIYNRLDRAFQSGLSSEECQLAASYFAVDYFTLNDKEENQVGGIDYIYPSLQSEFNSFALKSFYLYRDTY